MLIKRRLARSNIAMFVIPVTVAVLLFAVGLALAFFLLEQVYLPRLGVSLQELHQTGEQIEKMLADSAEIFCIYAGAVVTVLILTIVWTNLYLTRNLFCHIVGPLDILTTGVARIRDGNLDFPIDYREEDEFRPVCDAVDEMAARLKSSLEEQQLQQQKKQELIVGMSHDLKSPLTSIRAYTEALIDDVAKDEETRKRYLQIIHAKEMDIEAMVNRLFEFAKMDASAYPAALEPLPLREIVSCAAGEWSEEMDIETDIEPGLCIEADRELLNRIFYNLFSNSKKYGGKENLCVRITARRKGDMAEIAFSDNGKGVPTAQLSKLFDLFYRGDAARSAPENGSGLGLAVVQKAVETMHGSVQVKSGEEGGLSIVFRLPLAKEDSNVENIDY